MKNAAAASKKLLHVSKSFHSWEQVHKWRQQFTAHIMARLDPGEESKSPIWKERTGPERTEVGQLCANVKIDQGSEVGLEVRQAFSNWK